MATQPDQPTATSQWKNEPRQWSRQAGTIRLQVDAGTDFWRKTHDGGIRDNGHFYFQSTEGDFTARVKISGQYSGQYDQAGLMARVDQTTWLKCGVEYVDQSHLASAVVTRDWSDWSVRPIDEPQTTWWKLQRHEQTFHVAYSLDGDKFHVVRQAFLTDVQQLQVGIIACAPKGAGFPVTFSEFTVQNP